MPRPDAAAWLRLCCSVGRTPSSARDPLVALLFALCLASCCATPPWRNRTPFPLSPAAYPPPHPPPPSPSPSAIRHGSPPIPPATFISEACTPYSKSISPARSQIGRATSELQSPM